MLKGKQIAVKEFNNKNESGEFTIGVRPEFIKFTDDGLAVNIDKVYDLDRHKLINLSFNQQKLKMLVAPDEEIPASPQISFRPDRTFVYLNNWILN